MQECVPHLCGAERSLGQVVAYFTVREILDEASTAAGGVLLYQLRGFCRCGFATLGSILAVKGVGYQLEIFKKVATHSKEVNILP